MPVIKMHVETFKIEHLDKIKPIGYNGMFQSMCESIRQYDQIGKIIAFSLIHEDEIILIGGIYEIWEGVGEAFSIMSKSAIKYPKSLYASFSRSFETGIKIGRYRRVQSMVKADFKEGIRFIERLGFKREGLLKSWAPDKSDYYIYARIQ